MSDTEPNSFRNFKDGTKNFPITNQGRFESAIGSFRKLIDADANHARAHGWLSYTYVTGIIDDWKFPKGDDIPAPEYALVEARTLADEAVRLDPEDFDTHWAKAFVSLHSGDHAGAKKHFGTARKLNHGNRELLVENADERVYAGECDKAIELIERAWAIPDWHHWVYAWALYFKARKDNDPTQLDKAMDHLDGKISGKPGKDNTPAEIHLLRAAIHGQRSLLGTSGEKAKAVNERDTYEKLKKKTLSIQNLKDTNPFQKNDDLEYWLNGLKEAGVS